MKQNTEGHFDHSTTSRCVRDILLGLEFLHANGIIHGNLEGSNVYMTVSGHCKLSDYGLSIHRKPLQQGIRGFRLTPNWTAPEVLDAESNVYMFASDIWSLGCTTVELLTGYPPYSDIKSRIQSMFFVSKKSTLLKLRCSNGLHLARQNATVLVWRI